MHVQLEGTFELPAQSTANIEHEHVASDADTSLLRDAAPSNASTQDHVSVQGFTPSLASLQEEDEEDDEEAAVRVMALTDLLGERQTVVLRKLRQVYGWGACSNGFLS